MDPVWEPMGAVTIMNYHYAVGVEKVISPFLGLDDEARVGGLSGPILGLRDHLKLHIGRVPSRSCLSAPLLRRVRGWEWVRPIRTDLRLTSRIA